MAQDITLRVEVIHPGNEAELPLYTIARIARIETIARIARIEMNRVYYICQKATLEETMEALRQEMLNAAESGQH